MANYGQISKFKVSIEASWYNDSCYHVKIFKNQKFISKNYPLKILKICHVFGTLNKTANYGWISKYTVSMEVSWLNASIYHV